MFECPLERGPGLLAPPKNRKRDTPVCPGSAEARVELDGARVVRDGAGRVALVAPRGAPVVVGGCRFGLGPVEGKEPKASRVRFPKGDSWPLR